MCILYIKKNKYLYHNFQHTKNFKKLTTRKLKHKTE